MNAILDIRRKLKLALTSVLLGLLLTSSGAQEPPRKEILATRRTIAIRSKSFFVVPEEVEKELLARKELDELSLTITRDVHSADFDLYIRRLPFQNVFTYSLIDRQTNSVAASGAVNSLGGTVPKKVASDLIKKLVAARSAAPTTPAATPKK